MGAYANWDSSGAPELETLLELGQGGMAVAHLARTLGAGGFQRFVVLKRLGLGMAGSRDAIDRFLAEARVAASVHHVNVVGTQQVGRDAAGPYIVLDYVEGGSLDELVQAAHDRGESVPLPVLLRITLDALNGLRAVHEACDNEGRPLSILHRDVSLQNVLVGVRDGVARLADFGVAKSVLSRVQTDPGFLVGKILYFSPEYLLREPTGPTLDIYAIGVMLWLAINFDDPWPELHRDSQLIRAIVDDGLPRLPARHEVAPEISRLVMTACERDPRLRYQSAREMAAVLEGFDRERGWLATHSEVAELVERLLGARLARRRELIRDLHPESEGSRVRSLELARTRREASAAHSKARASPPPEQPARPRRLPIIALALSAAAFVGMSVLVLTATPEPAPPPAVAVTALPAPRQPLLPDTRDAALPAPAAPALVPVAPARAAETAPDPPPPAAKSAPKPATRAPRPTPATNQQFTPPAPAPTPEIKKQNPYR